MDITPDASLAMDIDNLEDEIPSSSPNNSGHALWKASQTPNAALRDLIVESSERLNDSSLNKRIPRWDGPSSPQEHRRSAPYNMRRRPPPRRTTSAALLPVTPSSANLSGATPEVNTLFGLIGMVQSAGSGDENSEQVSAAREKEKAVTKRKTGRSSMLPPPATKSKGKGKGRARDPNKDANKRRNGTSNAPTASLLSSTSTATFSDVSMPDVSSHSMDVERAVPAPPPPPSFIPSRSENASGCSRMSLDGEVPKCPQQGSRNTHGKLPSAPSKVVETTSSSNDVVHVAPTSLPKAFPRPKATPQTRLNNGEKAATCLSFKASKAPSEPSKPSSTGSLGTSSSVNRTEVIRQALAEASLPSSSERIEGQLPSISKGDSVRQGCRPSSREVTPQPTLSSNRSRPSTSAVSSRSVSQQPPIATQPKRLGTDPSHRPPPRQLGMGIRRVSSAPTAPLADRPLPTHQKGFKPPLLTGTQALKPMERPPPAPTPPAPPPRNEPSSDDTSFDFSFDLDPEELDIAMQEFD
ncbi:hypothetical protein DFS33DRAFT_207376 [Desarmillaria ectypa]|nr:hypothetical protein DFS33DRAFT_207376 [Desarmillaria ectypa]